MKKQIIEAIREKLEIELARLSGAGAQSAASAMTSAPTAEKQRDTTGLESAYLAHGYAQQCSLLAKGIEELEQMIVEDFTDQEIDIGALIEVEMDNETDFYILLQCGGGMDVFIKNQKITAITPESPLGKVLMGNIENGFVKLESGLEGIVTSVC